MQHPERQSTTLPNGITVISESAPQFLSASIAVCVLAGAIHEPDGKAGLAHVLEHLVFRGTRERSGEALQAAFAELGGQLNGRTLLDHTVYTATVLREDVSAALGLFAEMLTEPAFDPDDLELEKHIVEEENCRGCYNCTLNEAFWGTAFPDQNLHEPVIGYEDTVKALGREDMQAFHRQFYVGRNMVISVCGDLRHEDVVDAVSAAFGRVPEGEAAGLPEYRYHPGELLWGSNAQDATLWIGFDVTNLPETMKRNLFMFCDILGGHAMSLLMQELREKRGLVYGVWSSIETVARHDIFRLYIRGQAQRIGEIANIAIDTMKAAAFRLSDGEVSAAKRRYHVGHGMQHDINVSRVEDMATDIVETGKVTNVAERYGHYQKVTRAELEAAAQAMLALQPSLILQAPMRGAPKFADIRTRLASTVKLSKAV